MQDRNVDAPTAGHPKALSLGALVTEGKTKKIFRIDGSDLVAVVAKDDITAGDGAKHDVIPDKGRLPTPTTCHRFPPPKPPPPPPPATLSACSRPAACRSPSRSRTARPRSSRRPARCCPTRWWCGARR